MVRVRDWGIMRRVLRRRLSKVHPGNKVHSRGIIPGEIVMKLGSWWEETLGRKGSAGRIVVPRESTLRTGILGEGSLKVVKIVRLPRWSRDSELLEDDVPLRK